MIKPLRPLWQALALKIHSLGINDPAREFPRVLIDQLELRSTPIDKDTETIEATFLIDVVTKSDSPLESIEILEQVQELITIENFKVNGQMVQSLKAEALTPLCEVEDGVWRQLQRYRIILT